MTMNTYQETMRKLYDPENHEVLIASHRGKFSSSVMENTSLAFLTAIGEGAVWWKWIWKRQRTEGL